MFLSLYQGHGVLCAGLQTKCFVVIMVLKTQKKKRGYTLGFGCRTLNFCTTSENISSVKLIFWLSISYSLRGTVRTQCEQE